MIRTLCEEISGAFQEFCHLSLKKRMPWTTEQDHKLAALRSRSCIQGMFATSCSYQMYNLKFSSSKKRNSHRLPEILPSQVGPGWNARCPNVSGFSHSPPFGSPPTAQISTSLGPTKRRHQKPRNDPPAAGRIEDCRSCYLKQRDFFNSLTWYPVPGFKAQLEKQNQKVLWNKWNTKEVKKKQGIWSHQSRQTTFFQNLLCLSIILLRHVIGTLSNGNPPSQSAETRSSLALLSILCHTSLGGVGKSKNNGSFNSSRMPTIPLFYNLFQEEKTYATIDHMGFSALGL